MKAFVRSVSRMPRWPIWGLAPMALAFLMVTGLDVLQASSRSPDGLSQGEQASGGANKGAADMAVLATAKP